MKTIEDMPINKDMLFNKIPQDPKSFFVELGYDLIRWKASKTRICNKLNLNVGTYLTADDVYKILELISQSTSKNKDKAKQWLNLFNNISIEEEKSIFGEAFDIPEDILQKHKLSQHIVEIMEKHNIIIRSGNTYIKEINKRIDRYRFSLDRKIVFLLKELYEKKLIPSLADEFSQNLDLESRDVEQEKTINTNKKYIATNANGERFYFNDIATFAETHSLTKSAILKVINGSQKTHKKWLFSNNI